MASFLNIYKSVLFVVAAVVVLGFYYDLPHWLMQRPGSVHVWRQADCASYALNYYQNDRSFFSTQVHHRHAIDGKTTSEFPIIYYVASKFYKLFGFHDYYIRWINAFIFFITLIYVTLTAGFFIKHWFLQSIPALLLMMSCVMVYYSVNFLPDAPALCFALIGFYYFVKDYYRQSEVWDFTLAIILSTLAALLKISSGIILGSILAYLIFTKFFPGQRKYGKKHFFIAFSGLAAVFIWLIYVKVYNEIGQYFGNLQGTMGIWTIQKNEILYIIQRTFQEWMPALVSYKIWIFILPSFVLLIYYFQKLPRILAFFTCISFTAVIVYLLAFFAVFNVHDYYFINTLCFGIILSFALLNIIEKVLSKNQIKIFIGLSCLLFILCAEDTEAQFEFRRYNPDWNSLPHKDFYKIEPTLRSLGIDRHQLIYSPTDPSTNVTLYLMNNPGWTRLFNVTPQDAQARGAKYMVIDQKMIEEEEFRPYKTEVIGSFNELLIVKFNGQ